MSERNQKPEAKSQRLEVAKAGASAEEHSSEALAERLLAVAVRIVAIADVLPRTPAGRHVARRILEAGTSPGVNYEEARGAESKRDFAHKVGIVLKELKESRYWVRVAAVAELVKPPSRLDLLRDELGELIAIFGKTWNTARRGLDEKGEPS